MKILDLSMFDNLSSKDLAADQLKISLPESGTYLRDLVVSSTNEGNSFDQVERAVLQALKLCFPWATHLGLSTRLGVALLATYCNRVDAIKTVPKK